ncbi:ion channel [Nocardioides sp. TF02-7]|uniref:ion channel n=1 Tax=Nocardioides sp. TF02-7 TaxID=2917724 RepID=UPI001F0640F2|nr:ion channel [Nocardioides sp. TF02-7]UMG92305.1 ion channel [Nocardioides sp. TF02-7]
MRRSRSSPGRSPTSTPPPRCCGRAPSSHPATRRRGADPEPLPWFHLLFLSFTNLTSVGLSDIYAVKDNARSLVMIEQLAGVLYIALIVARLVGLTRRRR